MQCLRPMSMKHPVTAIWISHGCGQCLPCRLKKQSAWTFRNRLESQASHTSSFWTLTLNESGLQAMGASGPRKMMRAFFDNLRKSEARHLNGNPIRYFGCLEYGGKFGRPHFHMLIYNLEHNLIVPQPYRRNLPRPQLNISIWPHGSVDPGTFNPATIAYTSKYIFKDTRNGEPAHPFRTIRPAIGYYGLEYLAAQIAKKHSILPEPPVSFQMGSTTYFPDNWTRKTFDKCFITAGGKYEKIPTPQEKQMLSLQTREALRLLPRHIQERQTKRLETIEYLQRSKEEAKAAFEERASDRAQKINKKKHDSSDPLP